MTARSIRRALERKQKKLARKAEQQNSLATPTVMASSVSAPPAGVCFDSVDDLESAAPISTARLGVNRANTAQEPARLTEPRAQRTSSTGPRTVQGKAAASRNAVKAGLTGRPVLLSTEDVAEYERHLDAFRDEYEPVGLRECELVQSIADTFWRLASIPYLEMAIFAKGRIEFSDVFEEHSLAGRPHLIDAHTFLIYEKQIRNLQLQEARLVRRREKEDAELRKLQAERLQKAERTQNKDHRHAPAANGFEFSTSEFQSLPLPAPAGQQPVFNGAHGQIVSHRTA